MSYICLMVNRNGAVAAADSRETFPGHIHLDRRQKCFALPERKLIWACCGPTLRFGVDLPGSVRHILDSDRPMEDSLERVAGSVQRLTRLGPDPGPFCLTAARWEDGGFTVWDFRQVRSDPGERYTFRRRRWRVCGKGAVFLQAGAKHRLLPPVEAAGLTELSYEALRSAARERVTLAIRMDEQRRAADRHYNQTIGGQVRAVGIRVKGA
ncbi:MAG: hypothetical protein LUC30_07085 [Clostridiales bacterium]|nr:hypothetical protein [Clostridiales bacterium]